MKPTHETKEPFGSPLIGIIAIPVLLGFCAIGIYLGFFAADGIDRFGNWITGKAAPKKVDAHAAGKDASGTEHNAEVVFAPPFQNWPKENPDLAIVISGESFGHLRPCGCSPDQLGGMARRAGLLKYLREVKKWPYVCVDLGDLIEKNGPLEKLRYSYAVQTLKTLKYSSLGVGKKDLSLSFANIVGEAVNADPMKFAQANLTSSPDMMEIIKESKCMPPVNVVEQNGVKIGISSVMADSHATTLPDPSVKLNEMKQTAKSLLAEMTAAKVQVKFLMGYMSFEEGQQLAKDVPGFDLIVTKSTYEDATAKDAVQVGKTKVFWVGQKGKAAGVLGVFLKEGKFELEIVALDKHRFEEVQEISKIYGEFVRQIKQQALILNDSKQTLENNEQFVGAAKCAECHKKAYAKWKESGHAHALETLQDIKKTPFVGQDYNPECVKCHTLGFKFKSGFISPEKTPQFGGNQCENCHGPGSRHSADPKNQAFIADIRKGRHTIKEKCYECHDIENSPKFDFDKYWPKVAHPGKD